MAKTREERNAYLAEWRKRNHARVYEQQKRHRLKTYKTLRGKANSLLTAANYRAKKAGVPADLTAAWILDRLRRGVCEVTGLPLDLNAEGVMGPFSPSIDRIEPPLGYTEANCRMTITAFNLAKNRWSDDVLLHWARALIKQHDSTD